MKGIMHMKRNEIEEKDKWDLSTIFADVQEWQEAYQKAESAFGVFPELEQNMLKSADDLYQTVKQITETGEQVNRVYTYAHLKYSEDTSNPEAKKLMGQAQNLLTAFSEATAFFDTDLLSLKSEQLDTFLNESEDLREYEILLRDAFRYQPHTLSKAEEKLLASFQKERETASDVYEALTSADLKFGTILDEEGEPAELTDTNYVVFLRSPDRLVRKLAFKTLYSAYQGHENTFAGLYAGQLEAEKVIAKVRNFDSALQMSLFADHVTPEIYDNIIGSISGHLDVLFRYYRLKKKVLGLKELHIYDIYLAMLPDFRKEYTYPEAVEEVLSAVRIFGDGYAEYSETGLC